MDQQEFVPRSQSEEQQSQDEEEIDVPAQPYYWSTKPNTPKDEPTSLYDLPMVQSETPNDYQNGYMALDTADTSQSGEKIDTSRPVTAPLQAQRQQFSPDGDAYEYQYRPNNASYQQWSVPPFARRRMRNPARWVWLIILGLIFFGPLMHILGAFVAVAGVIILVLLLPFLLVLLVGVPIMLFRVGRGLGRASNGQRRWRYTNRWRYINRWRGPWGW